MNEETAIVVVDMETAIRQARARREIVNGLRNQDILRRDIDYGVIPGTTKPTLLKPGAERLCAAFGLAPRFTCIGKVEDWTTPLFHYQYDCTLVESDTGKIVASGIGSCNSMESKYRWRKADRVCPNCGKATIIKGKAEYGGGWLCFAKKGGCGAKFGDTDTAITGQPDGNVPNDDIYSIVNTIDKMAQKRAFIAAALIGANASEFFTQDIEDMPAFAQHSPDDVVTVEVVEVKRPTPAVSAPATSASPTTSASAEQWMVVCEIRTEATQGGKKSVLIFDGMMNGENIEASSFSRQKSGLNLLNIPDEDYRAMETVGNVYKTPMGFELLAKVERDSTGKYWNVVETKAGMPA